MSGSSYRYKSEATKWKKKKKESKLPKIESYFIQPIPVYAKDEPDVVCNSLFLDLTALTCISEQLNQRYSEGHSNCSSLTSWTRSLSSATQGAEEVSVAGNESNSSPHVTRLWTTCGWLWLLMSSIDTQKWQYNAFCCYFCTLKFCELHHTHLQINFCVVLW